MVAPNLVNDTLGTWEVDGTPMISPGWAVLNIHVLWQGPTVAVNNRIQAGGIGRKGYPPLIDETRLSVRFHIIGHYNIGGIPFADPQVGLALNYMYLREHVFDPVEPLRTSTLTIPGETDETYTAPIQFDPVPLPDLTGLVDLTTTVTVILPGGAHWPEES